MPAPVLVRLSFRLHRCPATDRDGAGLHPGPPAVLLEELEQLRSAGTTPRPDVAGRDLALLDVGVRIQGDAEQVVARVAGRDALRTPVVRDADLVHDPAALEPQRAH